METIHIENLRLRAIIGVHEWERLEAQEVLLNIRIAYNARPAMESDNIGDTLDYKILAETIIEKVEASRFFLLEKMAGMVLDTVMSHDLVREATVRIDKPRALRFADSVAVEIARVRDP